MPSDLKKSRIVNKEQVKFPEVEDIFHAPESTETAEIGKAGESEGVPQAAEAAPSISAAEALPQAAPAVLPIQKSPLLLEIESIMEENLREIYQNMPDELKIRFNSEGEKTAGEIKNLMQSLKATTKKLIDILKKWLLIIPGINKFFLEQEAKIKADKIMAIQLSKFQKQ
ncbi:MAG TPA: hypothetical protein VJ028_02610 [Patescibacteria group bacterium]|nr:hypothetical protein [Patescibacteria group bacterium]